MPDQAPPAPDGCVYGPWWNGRQWLALVQDSGNLFVYGIDGDRWWAGCDYSRAHAELQRLAKDNAELAKETTLQKQSLIDLSQHNADIAAEVKRLKDDRKELVGALAEVVGVLRANAPGTQLNRHEYDGLGIKCIDLINKHKEEAEE